MERKEEALLLSRTEAASALAVSTDTLRRLINDGELSIVRIGRSVLIPQGDVLDLVERRRRRPPRRRAPLCARCGRRIVGPRLVVGGLWTCAACVYEQEHPAKRGPEGGLGDRR